MKKKILVGVLVLTLVLGAISVYADSPDTNEYGRGYGHMNGDRYNERINPSDDSQWNENKKGFSGDQRNFTEEEREQRFQQTQDERSEYKQEHRNRDGSCHDSSGRKGRGNGHKRGHGNGMMGGYNY